MALQAIPKLVIALASAAYTYYANKKMLKDLKRKPIQDDRPSTTTTRGAYVPVLIGRRRLAPIVAWLSGRRQSGGSVYESAGHLICVGPASFLHKVLENGKPILSSVLSRLNTPSGSQIQTSNGRSFKIYWGDEEPLVLSTSLTGASETSVVVNADIPLSTTSSGILRVKGDNDTYIKCLYTSYLDDTFTIVATDFSSNNASSGANVFSLNEAEALAETSVPAEIGSFFPNSCYIYWMDTNLGQAGSYWPEFTYDIETSAKTNSENIPTSLSGSPPITAEYTPILDTENGSPGINFLDTEGDRTGEFVSGENAAIRFNEVSSDLTTWDYSDEIIYSSGISSLNMQYLVKLYGGVRNEFIFTGIAYDQSLVFPSVGNSIRVTFDVLIDINTYIIREDEYASLTLSILDESLGLKYKMSNIGTVLGLPNYKTEEVSEGISFSTYTHSSLTNSDPSLYGWRNYSITITALDDSIKFKPWNIEFKTEILGSPVDNVSFIKARAEIQNLVVDNAVEIDVRRAYLNNAGTFIPISEDLSSWTTLDDTHGSFDYLPSTDPDYITPPAEVTSLNQNRIQTPGVSDLTFIPRSISATEPSLSNYPEKINTQFYLYMPYGELEISLIGSTFTRTFSLVTRDSDLTWGSEIEDGTFDVTATEIEGWHKITVSDVNDQADEPFSIKLTLTHTYEKADIRIQDLTFEGLSKVTRIELNEEVDFLADNTGEVASRIPAVIGGANAAGAIYQLLFEKYPYGAGLDPTDYDLDSLRTVSDLLISEVLPVSIIADDGKDLEAVLANLLQDIGVMLYWNVNTGKWTFKAEREPLTSDIIDVELIDQFPQVSVNHDDSLPNQAVFSFSDINRKYKETTLLHDNDGEISEGYGTTKRTQSVRIPSVIDFETAKKVAERRAQEVLGTAISYQFKVGRTTTSLNPGDVVKINGEEPELRVLSVKEDPDSNLDSINAVTEFYGLPTVSNDQGSGGIGSTNALPAPDAAFNIVEIPRSLSSNVNALYVPRIRPDASTLGAFLHISIDGGVSYNNLDSSTVALAGGDLIETLKIDSLQNDPVGIKIKVEGPDSLAVQDLTSQTASWRSGSQIAIIGEEWMFVKKVESITSTVFQLTGILRSRYSTEKVRHAAGDQVYILSSADLVPINFTSAIGTTPYVKTQPYNQNGSVSLALVTPDSKQIVGDGTIPPRPFGINTPEGSKSWISGEDVVLSWRYRNGLSVVGAGEFNAGTAVSTAVPEGTFTLTLLDSGDTVITTITGLASPTYTITNANLVSLFGGEPSSFKAKIVNISTLGLISRSTEETLTRI